MISAVDLTILGDPLPTLLGNGMPTLLGDPLPTLLGNGLPVLLGNPMPVLLGQLPTLLGNDGQTGRGAAFAWVVGAVVLGVGISAIHGAWAYGDWTCAFKNCVAVAPVRRRRRKKR